MEKKFGSAVLATVRLRSSLFNVHIYVHIYGSLTWQTDFEQDRLIDQVTVANMKLFICFFFHIGKLHALKKYVI